jgi:Raf kinase inhibitor-like YbhB/YbcL family protein
MTAALAALAAFALTSPAFPNGGLIPRAYTCDAAAASPPLRWTVPPRGTRSLALSVKDPDAPAGTFVHWTAWNVSPRARRLAPGQHAPREGRNSAGARGYTPPCPPSGPAHHYVFRLYALRAKLGLAAGASPTAFDRALRGRVIAVARLVGRYRRRTISAPAV